MVVSLLSDRASSLHSLPSSTATHPTAIPSDIHYATMSAFVPWEARVGDRIALDNLLLDFERGSYRC